MKWAQDGRCLVKLFCSMLIKCSSFGGMLLAAPITSQVPALTCYEPLKAREIKQENEVQEESCET